MREELEELARRDAKLARSAMAASALQLGREMDSDNSATSKSMCARALIETLRALHALAPAVETNTSVDELRRRREKRLASR